ncbi:MAG: cadmium-translocating P-type ATPase [Acholeplasmatales bacterium]|nr:cadmium-translocating P-type ATPase [Acholeplasmatales bacterium]
MKRKLIIRLITALIIWIVAITLNKYDYSLYLFIASYIIAGYDILFNAIRNLFRGKLLDEFFLMSIASIGAFFLKENIEAVAVMIFFQIGELFQEIAVERSRRAIVDTMNLKVNKCYLENGLEVDPEDVEIGNVILVKPGEMVPLDGICVSQGSVNVASLTGEALDVDLDKGDNVLSGSINTLTPLLIEVTKEYYDSTAAKILDMVENATMKKAKSEKFISKFAKVYTPIVVILALLLAFIPPLILGFNENFNDWLYRALSFLVVSCPCALVVSVPLTYFAGIGANAKNKIVVKGGSYLEDLALCNTVVLDKTGTLTKAEFKITKVIGNNEDEILKIAKGLEKNSTHPLAQVINKHVEEGYDFEIEETPGYGIIGKKDGKRYICGSAKLLAKYNINPINIDEVGSVLFIANENECIGAIILEDTIKEEAYENIRLLKFMGKRIIVLSGDIKESVEAVCKKLEINEYYYSLLPQDKVSKAEEIIKNNSGKVLFVGDGINDSPVLAIADIGVSMGQIGSDAALEASDVVILNDNLSALPKMIKIAKKTKRIVLQNIIMAIGIKALILALCALNILGMEWAIFADVGVCVLAVINAMRALRTK